MLTQEDVDRLKKRDLANIMKKMKAGKPLTGPEMARLSSAAHAAPVQAFAANQVALAELLGVTRRTIHTLSKKPDAPKAASNGKHDVQAWRAYLKQLGTRTQDGDADQGALQRRNLALRNEEREFRLAALKKKMHDKDACAASLARILSDHLSPLLGLGARLAAQFPELGQQLRDAADKEVESTFEAIREGLPR